MEKMRGGEMLLRNPVRQHLITDLAEQKFHRCYASESLKEIEARRKGKLKRERDDARGTYTESVSWETGIKIHKRDLFFVQIHEGELFHTKHTVSVTAYGDTPEPVLQVRGRETEWVDAWDREGVQKAIRRAERRSKNVYADTKRAQQDEHHRRINRLQAYLLPLGLLAAGSFGVSMAHFMSGHPWILTDLPVLKALHVSSQTALIWEPVGEGALSLLAFAALKKTNADLEKYDAHIRRSLITN